MMAAVTQFSFVPFAETRELSGDLQELFADIDATLPPEHRVYSGECHPALDVVETQAGVEVMVDVAGVPEQALRILFRGDTLLIAGEKAPGPVAPDPTFHLVEREFADGLSRTVRSESPGSESEIVVVERAFDGRGFLRGESLPYSSGTPLVRTFAYDALGRPTLVSDTDEATVRAHSYQPWTAIEETYFGSTSPGQRAERSERSLDGLGRLVRVAQFEDAVAATLPFVVSARYDAADRP